MTTFQINKNTYAIGNKGKPAIYVARLKGKNAVGVRGVRPILDERFKVATAPKVVAELLREYV